METVATETFASRATSRRLMGFPPRRPGARAGRGATAVSGAVVWIGIDIRQLKQFNNRVNDCNCFQSREQNASGRWFARRRAYASETAEIIHFRIRQARDLRRVKQKSAPVI